MARKPPQRRNSSAARLRFLRHCSNMNWEQSPESRNLSQLRGAGIPLLSTCPTRGSRSPSLSPLQHLLAEGHHIPPSSDTTVVRSQFLPVSLKSVSASLILQPRLIPDPGKVDRQKVASDGPQDANQTVYGRGQGKFYNLYGSGHSAGALTAWAWGVSRIIDAIEITPATNINPARIGVTGCSRNGKGAFVAGALDDRVALTIPQESGSGGSACWRLSDYQKSRGENVQTASQIITENVWFSTAFNPNVNQVSRLPFDHHSLAALVAPRGLYVIENTSMEWLGALSTYGCMKAGSLVYQALGVSGNMGYSQVGHGDHCGFPAAQQGSELNSFINKFLLDQSVTTNVFRTDGNFNFNQADWVDWSVPTLN